MTREAPDNRPFVLARDDPYVLLRFSEYVDHDHDDGFEAELSEHVAKHERVVCDMSGCADLTTRWLRLFHRLSLTAKKQGKVFAICAMNDEILNKADFIAVRKKLTLIDEPDEVLEL